MLGYLGICGFADSDIWEFGNLLMGFWQITEFTNSQIGTWNQKLPTPYSLLTTSGATDYSLENR
jgi:hypothetical protein